MSKHSNKKEDYTNLLAQLRDLSIEDLLLLYIEAKTGSQEDIDKIPLYLQEAVNDLGDELNKIYADKIIDSLFKK